MGSEMCIRDRAKSLYNVPKGTQALTKGNLEMMTGQFGKTSSVEPLANTIVELVN